MLITEFPYCSYILTLGFRIFENISFDKKGFLFLFSKMAGSNFWPAPRRLTGLTTPMGIVSVKMMVGFVMSVRRRSPKIFGFYLTRISDIIHLCLVPQDIYQMNRLAGVNKRKRWI